MHILRKIDIDPTQNVALAFVSAGDPSSVGLAAGVNSLAIVIGGDLAGNVYLKDDVEDTDWTRIVNAHP